MKLLVIEVDSLATPSIQQVLSSHHYEADQATINTVPWLAIERLDYNLILLDVGVESLEKNSFYLRFQALETGIPLLVLADLEPSGGLTPTAARKRCAQVLQAGADDCVIKPFEPEELVARVQILRRRRECSTPSRSRTWGALSSDPCGQRVIYAGQPVHLTPRGHAILNLFLRNSDRTFKIEEILSHVWGSEELPRLTTVRSHIWGLRRALVEAGAPQNFIETVHQTGYRLNPVYGDGCPASVPVVQGSIDLQWQALFEYALDAIAIADDDGRYTDANPAACELFGVSKDEFLQLSIADFADPELDIRQIWQQFLQQGQVSGNFRLYRPDGTVRETEFNAIANFVPGRHLSILRDVSERVWLDTERRAVEVALRESERRLATLVSNLPGYVYRVLNDPNYTADFISEGVVSVTGYTQEEYLINRTISCGQEIHPDDAEQVWNLVQDAVKLRQPYECEYRIITKTGEEKWVWERGRGIYTLDGSLCFLEGFVTDITVRKRAEVELQQREEFLSSIYDGVNEAVFVIEVTEDNEFYYSSFNRLAEQFSGLSTHDIHGKTPEDAFGLRVGTDFRKNYERCLTEGASICYEERIIFENRVVWTLTHLSPLRNSQGRIYRLIGTAVDISDRKQTEIALYQNQEIIREQLAEIEAIYQTTPVGLAILDRELRFVRLNQQLAAMNNIPLEQHLGRTVHEILPHLADAVEPALHRIIETGDAVLNLELEGGPITQPDAHRTWLENWFPLKDTNDQVVGINVVVQDITERKQAELQLQQQIRQEYLLTEIAQEIRQSLDVDEVLSRTVHRVREYLNADRVIIFRFRPNWHGDVITESVRDGWTAILSTTIYDPCFSDRFVDAYRQGRISNVSNIDDGDLEPCHAELLRQFQVQANLVVPILQGDSLWGLLIAHQCSGPRQWQDAEISLLRRLATQVDIAIHQSELYEQARRELLERGRMQRVLEENEERFRSLNAAAPIAICQANADGLCLYSNTRWQEMSGLTFSDSLGTGWLSAVHPDDRGALINLWSAYVDNGGEFFHEFRLLTPQGVTQWVSTRAAAMKSSTGETIGYVSIGVDITERKQAEAALRESQQRLQTILDNSPAIIFLVDTHDRHLLVNRSHAELLATTPDQIVGKTVFDLWPADIASIFAAQNRQVLETGNLLQVEDVVPLADGLHTYVTVKFPLFDATGTPYGVCGISTDITEKKKLEAQFFRAQRLESLGTLASGIAHDLNNVLTPVLAIAKLMQMKHPDLDAQSLAMLNALESSANRGADMVKQILTFARGTEGDRVLLQVSPLLREVIRVIQQTFPKTIDIQQNIPNAASWMVFADPTYLHQILMNLCINARDAMPEGGTLTLSVDICTVEQSFAQAQLNAQGGTYVVITVADTGVGIPAGLRDRIFDPFFTTKPLGKGTGLGLSTVLGIVRNYGGFVQVLSEVGEGTQFKVHLPLHNGHLTSVPSAEDLLQGHGERILIVDDDDAVRYTNQSLLENYGYTVCTARHGLEALDVYAEHQDEVRLVLLDVMMPTLGGIPLIQRLKSIAPDLEIIAISGLPANREPTLAAGASVFLAKPYSLDTLLRTVWDVLS